MDNRLKVTGMILSVTPAGEYDRRVVILTREKGKISAFAPGARRSGSQLISSTQMCVFGTFRLFAGKDAYRINEVEPAEYFTEIRENADLAYHAMYFCEIADYFAREGNDEREMLGLLYAALKAAVRKKMSLRLITSVFEMKAVCINGEAPLLSECVICHRPTDEKQTNYFSVNAMGIVCRDCAEKAKHIAAIGTSLRYALWYILATPPEKLFAFTLDEASEQGLIRLAGEYLNSRTGHEFAGAKLLEII